MNRRMLSAAIPVLSVVVFLAVLYFTRPSITGLAVYNPETPSLVEADVTLKTTALEIIPGNAAIEVWLDDRKASMLVRDFIEKTSLPSEIAQGELPDISYVGLGYTGNHVYTLPLSAFSIGRSLG